MSGNRPHSPPRRGTGASPPPAGSALPFRGADAHAEQTGLQRPAYCATARLHHDPLREGEFSYGFKCRFVGKMKTIAASEARWRSGDAADCKSVYAGSIPARASISSSFSRLCFCRSCARASRPLAETAIFRTAGIFRTTLHPERPLNTPFARPSAPPGRPSPRRGPIHCRTAMPGRLFRQEDPQGGPRNEPPQHGRACQGLTRR